MARGLGQGISKWQVLLGVPGMQWLVPTKCGTKERQLVNRSQGDERPGSLMHMGSEG